MKSVFNSISQRGHFGDPLDVVSHVGDVFNLTSSQVVDQEHQLADLEADSKFVKAASDEVTHDQNHEVEFSQ